MATIAEIKCCADWLHRLQKTGWYTTRANMAGQTQQQPPAYQGPPPYHSHTLTKTHHTRQQLFGQHPEHGVQPGSTNELSSALDQLTRHGGPVFTQCADKLLELLSLIHQQPTVQCRCIRGADCREGNRCHFGSTRQWLCMHTSVGCARTNPDE